MTEDCRRTESGEQIFFIFTDYTTIHDDEHEPYYYFRVVILALRDFYKKYKQANKRTRLPVVRAVDT